MQAEPPQGLIFPGEGLGFTAGIWPGFDEMPELGTGLDLGEKNNIFNRFVFFLIFKDYFGGEKGSFGAKKLLWQRHSSAYGASYQRRSVRSSLLCELKYKGGGMTWGRKCGRQGATSYQKIRRGRDQGKGVFSLSGKPQIAPV